MEENKIKTNYSGKDNRPHKNGSGSHNKGYNQKRRNEKREEYVPMYPERLLSVKVKDLKLSPGLTKVLLDGGIDSVNKIVRKTVREMYQIKFFNKKHLLELSKALKRLGVDFKPDEKGTQAESVNNREDDTPVKEIKGQRAEEDKREVARGKVKREKDNPLDKVEVQVKASKSSKNIESEQNDNSPKGRKEDNTFDIYRIFPRKPFKPTPPVEEKKDYFIKFQRAGKWGFKNRQGKEIIPPIYDEVFSFKEDIACVERKQMFGFINRANELIIPYKYECASSFSEGLACVCLNSKCGYINAKDEVVIPFVYDAGTAFTDGTARVKQNGRWGTYYLESNEVDWVN